jgi:hypothetical protein
MSITRQPSTSGKVIKLAGELSDRSRYKVVLELLASLDEEQLEDLRSEIDQLLVEKQFLGEERNLQQIIKRKEKYIEIKIIDHNPYAYLRARDKSSQVYLGRVWLMPGQSYQLTNKTTQETRVLSVLRYEPEAEETILDGKPQVVMVVQQHEPHDALKKYYFPECMKSTFAKRDWLFKQIAHPEGLAAEAKPASRRSPVAGQIKRRDQR